MQGEVGIPGPDRSVVQQSLDVVHYDAGQTGPIRVLKYLQEIKDKLKRKKEQCERLSEKDTKTSLIDTTTIKKDKNMLQIDYIEQGERGRVIKGDI